MSLWGVKMEFSKAIIVSSEDFVSQALPKIKRTGTCALVFDGKKYPGAIDERALREKRMDPAKTKCNKMAVKTPTLSKDSDIIGICSAFFAGRLKALPVMDGTKVLGMIDRWTLMFSADKAGYLKGHKVTDHMSSPIMSVNSHASAAVANSIMRDANVRRLAVVQNGNLVGIVSVFDLLPTRERDDKRSREIMGATKNSQERLPVYSFMKTAVETIEFGASLSEAVKKMLDRKIAALIVVDGQRPVGIITSKDILKTVVRAQMKLPVVISGLDEINKDLGVDIINYGEKLLSKLRKGGASGISIHIKREGNHYFVSAHLTGDMKLRSHASNFELMTAVRDVIDEIESQAQKVKVMGISGRRN